MFSISNTSPTGPACLEPAYAPPEAGVAFNAIISTGRDIIFLIVISCK